MCQDEKGPLLWLSLHLTLSSTKMGMGQLALVCPQRQDHDKPVCFLLLAYFCVICFVLVLILFAHGQALNNKMQQNWNINPYGYAVSVTVLRP